LALAFVYGLKKDWAINRFATSEQKRYDGLLRLEPKEKLVEIAKQGFGWVMEPLDLSMEEKRFDFLIGAKEYLDVAPHFHSSEWKLVNRFVQGGKIYIKKTEAARLLSGAVKNKIIRRASEEEIRKFEVPGVFSPQMDSLKAIAAKKGQAYEDSQVLVDLVEARPPCVVAIINDLSAGKSLSHMARFTITTFMINIGKTVEDVLILFSNVADFDAGKARYQVEHIAGEIGSKTKYSTPKCDVLRSFGLCVNPNHLCEEVWHPVIYYRSRVEELQRGSKASGGKENA
jgi:DNA primase large subunit